MEQHTSKHQVSLHLVFSIKHFQSMLGTLVHVSADSLGAGWCLAFLAITCSGSIVAQEFSPATVGVLGPSLPMPSDWSHIVQTWSVMNGLRLYVNGVLITSRASAVSHSTSGRSNFVTLADSRNGSLTWAPSVLLNRTLGALNCDRDDFRVYSRELTASDVLQIYQA
jgi:Concanavalin A-like lectin/glucanases superfamily